MFTRCFERIIEISNNINPLSQIHVSQETLQVKVEADGRGITRRIPARIFVESACGNNFAAIMTEIARQ